MTHIPACPRIKVATLGNLLPEKFITSLEQNQQIPTCCRHPENHEIEAWKTTPNETTPDVYILHCTCGRRHIRFMCGSGVRPYWEVA